MFDKCCPKLLAPKAVTKKAQQKLRSSLKPSRKAFYFSAGKHWNRNTTALAQSTRKAPQQAPEKANYQNLLNF